MKSLKFISIVLVVSVVLNINSMLKIKILENKIDNVNSSVNNVHSSINHISSNVNQQLREFQGNTSWITPINFEVKSRSDDEITLKASWQIKDLDKDSQVLFNYALDETFKKIETTEEAPGKFYTEISIKQKLEPEWMNIVMFENDAEKAMQEAKKSIKQVPTGSFNYFISMETETSTKSSDVAYYSTHVGATEVYGILESRVDLVSKRDSEILSLDVSLEHLNANEIENKIKNVVLRAYRGEDLISTTPVTPVIYQNGAPASDIPSFHILYEDKEDKMDKLILEVVYSNDKLFSKEIYVR